MMHRRWRDVVIDLVAAARCHRLVGGSDMHGGGGELAFVRAMRPSSLHRLALFTLAAAVPAVAQGTPAATLLARSVRAGGQVAAAPAVGSSVWGGFASGTSGSVGNATCSLQDQLATTSGEMVWNVGCAAVWQGAAEAIVEVRYEFVAPAVGPATILCDWQPGGAGTGACVLQVDLHDDGIVDAVGSASLPVVLGPNPLRVRLRAAATATAGTWSYGWFSSWNYSGSASGLLVLRVLPDHAQVASTAAACSGAAPTFATAPTFAGAIELTGAFGTVDDLALLVLGFGPTAVPLPLPPGCLLTVTPDRTELALVGPERTAAWTLTVPPAVRPLTFHAQLLGVDVAPFSILGSAALAVTSP